MSNFKVCVCFLFLCLNQIILAQSSSILKEIEGEVVSFHKIYDESEEDIYGYFLLKDLGFSEPYKRKYEYEVLDKNFNNVANGNFYEFIYNKRFVSQLKTVLNGVKYNGNKLLFYYGNYIEDSKFNTIFNLKHRFLDLKTGTISDSYVNDGNQLKPSSKLEKNEIKHYQSNDTNTYMNGSQLYSYYVIPNKGFISASTQYESEKNTFMFDGNGKNILTIDHDSEKEGVFYPSIIKDGIILNASRRIGEDNILVYDSENGKMLYKRKHGSDKYSFSARKVIIIKDEIFMIGEAYIQKANGERFPTGIYKRTIDKKTGDEKKLEIINYSKFPTEININEKGEVKGKGNLRFQFYDLTPNGDLIAIAEAYKERSRKDAYNGLFFMQFDKDMKIKNVKEYGSQTTIGSKFSYAQDLPENKGKIMCFVNKDEEKNWELVTLALNYDNNEIINGNLKLEKTKSEINFFPSKKGYISILEFTKKTKSTKEKRSFRIEKLKY